jgi:glutathione-dependent peroxiredoxin
MNDDKRAVRIAEGGRVEAGRLRVYRDGHWEETDGAKLFTGRRVIVFGVPGAFTPTCSSQHLPRFNEMAPSLLARGVDEIVCVSVNDPHVMEAWARDQEPDNITLLADGNGEFTEAIGMLVDKRDEGYGLRSWRYSMLVNDGTVEKLFSEPDETGDPFKVSDAETMLHHLDPDAKVPDQVVIFTREGCPHCARAKEMLEQAGFTYVEFALDDNVRGTVLGAVAGRTTTPQIFLNGQLLGGADELEERFYGASGPPESRPT